MFGAGIDRWGRGRGGGRGWGGAKGWLGLRGICCWNLAIGK